MSHLKDGGSKLSSNVTMHNTRPLLLLQVIRILLIILPMLFLLHEGLGFGECDDT